MNAREREQLRDDRDDLYARLLAAISEEAAVDREEHAALIAAEIARAVTTAPKASAGEEETPSGLAQAAPPASPPASRPNTRR